MSHETGPHTIHSHVAVHIEPYITVFGGKWLKNDIPVSPHEIWMYNIYTEQWRKYIIPDHASAPPSTVGACAVAVEENVYLFGGVTLPEDIYNNALWKLSRTSNGCFIWRKINISSNINSPSPRESHTGWEYEGMLWIFGGIGAPPVDYLHDHGDFNRSIYNTNASINNQFLRFEPSCNKWTDVKCFGSVPTPRAGHGTAKIRNTVWLYGGCNGITLLDELFEINMCTLNWTQIQIDKIKPQGRYYCPLNAVSDNKLVVHGGNLSPNNELNDTWIFDLSSRTWRQLTSVLDHPRKYHTGTTAINNSVLIIGGSSDDYPNTFQVMLEPRSLQQMAMKTIYKHRTELPWKYLPPKLIARLGIFQTEEDIREQHPAKKHESNNND